MTDIPETRYAKTADGVHIAYQVLGDGPRDLLSFGYGSNFSIDSRDEEPHLRHFEHRLASFSRFIRFDPRGMGLSDPVSPDSRPSIENWVDDALAVLDAADSREASFLACGTTAADAVVAAATHADRCASLVLVNTYACMVRQPDYPHGYRREFLDEVIEGIVDTSADREAVGPDDVELLTPSLAPDPDYRAWWRRVGQRNASPAAARARLITMFGADVRAVLPSVRCPTLVVQRCGVAFLDIGHGRYLAEHIAGARLVELPGVDNHPYAGDSEAVIEEIEEFLTGVRWGSPADRVLATVLFTDIVGSTEHAVRVGDRAWRTRLDRHEAIVDEDLRRFRGRRVKFTGDGILATFDGPARAMRCARSIETAAQRLGLEVRAGLHTGEVEVRGDDLSGIAVHIAERVCAHAGPGEVLVSRTVTDLVAGSGIEFDDRGEHELKGVPGAWRLFAVKV